MAYLITRPRENIDPEAAFAGPRNIPLASVLVGPLGTTDEPERTDKVPRPAFRQANIAYEDDVQNRQSPDRHLGLDIRGLAPTLLPRRDSAQRLAVMVRATVCHDRDQRLVLPHTIVRSRATMARAHAGELSLRLEGIEIHHPLEAFDGAIG